MRAMLWWQVLVYVLGRWAAPAESVGGENMRYGTVTDVAECAGGCVLEAWWGSPGEPTTRQQVQVDLTYDVRFGDRVRWDRKGRLWWHPDGGKSGLELTTIGQAFDATE